jgi:hypothetical protein
LFLHFAQDRPLPSRERRKRVDYTIEGEGKSDHVQGGEKG